MVLTIDFSIVGGSCSTVVIIVAIVSAFTGSVVPPSQNDARSSSIEDLDDALGPGVRFLTESDLWQVRLLSAGLSAGGSNSLSGFPERGVSGRRWG
jgi:hypothetical protein